MWKATEMVSTWSSASRAWVSSCSRSSSIAASREGKRTRSASNSLVRWERIGAHYLGLLHFACALIAFGQAL